MTDELDEEGFMKGNTFEKRLREAVSKGDSTTLALLLKESLVNEKDLAFTLTEKELELIRRHGH